MINRYARGTEAWFAMQDAVSAVQTIESGVSDAEEVFERIIDDLETMETEKKEAEDELEALQADWDELKAKYEAIAGIRGEVITMITNLLVAAEAVVNYCKPKLVELGAFNATSPDSDRGDSRDGGGENHPDKDAG